MGVRWSQTAGDSLHNPSFDVGRKLRELIRFWNTQGQKIYGPSNSFLFLQQDVVLLQPLLLTSQILHQKTTAAVIFLGGHNHRRLLIKKTYCKHGSFEAFQLKNTAVVSPARPALSSHFYVVVPDPLALLFTVNYGWYRISSAHHQTQPSAPLHMSD